MRDLVCTHWWCRFTCMTWTALLEHLASAHAAPFTSPEGKTP